jgi:hypothetical protein
MKQTLVLLAFLIVSAVTGTQAAMSDACQTKLRSVIPDGWELRKQEGAASLAVMRKAAISPKELNLIPIPSSPCDGEGSMKNASSMGIRVWYSIESLGACSEDEYNQRKARNIKLQAERKVLMDRIEHIPLKPNVKPSLLARAPRNEQEKELLNQYESLLQQVEVLPTHYDGNQGFSLRLIKSFWGAEIIAPTVLEEIEGVKKAIEAVLVPYEGTLSAHPTTKHCFSGEWVRGQPLAGGFYSEKLVISGDSAQLYEDGKLVLRGKAFQRNEKLLIKPTIYQSRYYQGRGDCWANFSDNGQVLSLFGSLKGQLAFVRKEMAEEDPARRCAL